MLQHFSELSWKLLRFCRTSIQLFQVYFPAVLFVFGCGFIFYQLPQARDMLAISAEHQFGPVLLLCCSMAFAYVTWYTSYLVIHAKWFREHGNFKIPKSYRWFPRHLGMLAIGIPGFALLSIAYADVSVMAYYLVMLAYVALIGLSSYVLYIRMFVPTVNALLWPLLVIILAGAMLWNGFLHNFNYSFNLRFSGLLLISTSILFLFYTASRVMNPANGSEICQLKPIPFLPIKIPLPAWHQPWFVTLNLLALVLGIVYSVAMQSIEMARFLGPYSIPFLAFTLFLGLGNIIGFIGAQLRFKLHIPIILLGILVGYFTEPHWVRMSKGVEPQFEQRLNSQTYADQWIDRWEQLDSNERIPVFIVLADGGASRSGYWTSTFMGNIHDEYASQFDRSLFSMSGASGGAVGVSAYYGLLQEKADGEYCHQSQDFFANDFLSFTMMRLIGPDLMMHFIPDAFQFDRAGSLELSMERTAERGPIARAFSHPFSEMESQFRQRLGTNEPMPALFLNITKVRSGMPGVVSNLVIDEHFNGRIDVLNMIDTSAGTQDRNDLNLSTAAVLSSRFPYISPAGRISNSYFIDGGYFDNSGAGVTQELLAVLIDRLKVRDPERKIRNRLCPILLHFQNSSLEQPKEEAMHPAFNDLLSPILGITNVRSSQTQLNDERLKQFMEREFNGYRCIELNLLRKESKVNNSPLRPNDDEEFSMNWVLSHSIREEMDEERMIQFEEKVKPVLDSLLLQQR